MTLGGTVETVIDMVFNYGTLSETYKSAAYDAWRTSAPRTHVMSHETAREGFMEKKTLSYV